VNLVLFRLFFGKYLFLSFESKAFVVISFNFEKLFEMIFTIKGVVVEGEGVQSHNILTNGTTETSFVINLVICFQFLHGVDFLVAKSAVIGGVRHV